MKAEPYEMRALLRMPLFVVIALWFLYRRATARLSLGQSILVATVNYSDELAIFEWIDALHTERGYSWLERVVLYLIQGYRRDVHRMVELGWMVVGSIPKRKD